MAVVFKRIAKTPPAPKPVEAPVVPKDPFEAYLAGKEFGEKLIATQTLEIPTATNALASKTFVVPTKPTTLEVVGPVTGKPPKPAPMWKACGGTELFKPSDTGIGFKRWATWIEQRGATSWVVLVEWGHESKSQQSKAYSFLTESRAKMAMTEHIAGKLKRGYKRTK